MDMGLKGPALAAARSGGVRNAGGELRSRAPSGELAAASRRVSDGRFHFSSISLSTEVWSSTSGRCRRAGPASRLTADRASEAP